MSGPPKQSYTGFMKMTEIVAVSTSTRASEQDPKNRKPLFIAFTYHMSQENTF